MGKINRWSDEKKAAFAADLAAGLDQYDLAEKYQTSAAAARTRMLDIRNAGNKRLAHNGSHTRHTNFPTEAPGSVRALNEKASAVLESRTLFPTRRSSAIGLKNLLVSGRENRKIGNQVLRGQWRGFPIYTLTLEERATCPSSCAEWRTCYGNGMPFATRVINDEHFEKRLRLEVGLLAMRHPQGFLIRLHVLGDFYSLGYVRLWAKLMAEHPNLHVYGYTARSETSPIGAALHALKLNHFSRWRVRWSERLEVAREIGGDIATVVGYVPAEATAEGGIVCSVERDAAATCASCGLCWSQEALGRPIVFVRHGPRVRVPRNARTPEPLSSGVPVNSRLGALDGNSNARPTQKVSDTMNVGAAHGGFKAPADE